MDLDLRKLRYFVVLAEELNFGRAAGRLHIAQPVLSRQIRALEDELHVRLFVRDKRSTELTAAGRQLLDDGKPLLAAAEALKRRVAQAARGTTTFSVGFMPGITVTDWVRAFGTQHPDVEVELVRTTWNNQVDVLRDGRVDVSIVRLPIDQRGLKVRPMFTEPRVAVLPADHRLAGKESIEIVDLAAEHLLNEPGAVPEWRDISVQLRDGTAPPARGYTSIEEKLEDVASGQGIAIIPKSTSEYYRRPDVTQVPVGDIGPNHVCLAWIAPRRSPLIHDFAEIVG
ncbi:LysR substrate-binding domain-containing protein [Kibdelosporangium philippinense]|uniref:LysR substrate-binding domain-containing protein n=1 Tax=Kibdelosporangium philippinense TaxID=211113 RepID=A0ABS8Z7X3_9PSEU|nr:LysR family transcriptional regulator [Kibdelosporangium philippinense]MCE7001932.1 LysR substrate-binding domain-containing protein [Kibdelosporangium philippinense]